MHVAVRLEVIFNQLVFIHALRTRVNTATVLDPKSSKVPPGKDEKKQKGLGSQSAKEPAVPVQTPGVVSGDPVVTVDPPSGEAPIPVAEVTSTTGYASEAGPGSSISASTSTAVSNSKNDHDTSSPTASTSTATLSAKKDKDASSETKKKEETTVKQISTQAGSLSNLITVDSNHLQSFLEITARKILFQYDTLI
jgi:hypothetical protein